MIGVGDLVSADGQVYEVKTVKPDWMGALRGLDDEFLPGQIRMDLSSKRLVRLVESHYTEEEFMDVEGVTDMPWVVEDVLEGTVYTRNDSLLSQETFNEMETLAWATEDDLSDPEIEGD